MANFFGVKIPMSPWLVLAGIVILAAVLAYLINIVLLWALKRVVKKTVIQMDDRNLGLLERYLFPLLLVGALMFIADTIPLPPKVLKTGHQLLVLSGLLLAIFLLTKCVLVILRNLEVRYEAVGNIKGPIEIFTKIVFIAVGGMLILDNLGISLTPILTTLGVGSLGVAIALQDTLGNFFAGLYIKADRPIEVGHFIRLESGEEGYVSHIGWRSTRVRMLPNNMVVVPNSKLVQSVITNYYLPERELAVQVQVGVHYNSDLEEVERVTIEVAKEVLETVLGGVRSFEPHIRYHTFGESSVNFTVGLRADEFAGGFLLKHEFIKRLQARYKKEGITIPFPVRTIHFENGSDRLSPGQGAVEKPAENQTRGTKG